MIYSTRKHRYTRTAHSYGCSTNYANAGSPSSTSRPQTIGIGNIGKSYRVDLGRVRWRLTGLFWMPRSRSYCRDSRRVLKTMRPIFEGTVSLCVCGPCAIALILALVRNAAAVIMKMAYGYTVSDHQDFFVDAAEETSRITGYAAQPGRWLVDYYPICQSDPFV